MAPLKRPIDETDTTEATKPPSKRCKRGKIRRFENGLLDVERKGKYTRLIKSNSQSPLFRLPAEIRNRIFGLVLGGGYIKINPTRHHKSPEERERGALSLLRVCRQVYAETAVLPYALNTFAFERFFNFSSSGLRYQRDAIRRIRFPMVNAQCTLADELNQWDILHFLTRWPNLEHIHIDTIRWKYQYPPHPFFDANKRDITVRKRQTDIEKNLQRYVRQDKFKKGIKLEFERLDKDVEGHFLSPLYQFL